MRSAPPPQPGELGAERRHLAREAVDPSLLPLDRADRHARVAVEVDVPAVGGDRGTRADVVDDESEVLTRPGGLARVPVIRETHAAHLVQHAVEVAVVEVADVTLRVAAGDGTDDGRIMVGTEETHATPEPGVTGLVASRARFADLLGGARLDARDRSLERPAAHRVAARLPVHARARPAGLARAGEPDRVEAPERHRAALAVVQLADARGATLAIVAVGLPVAPAHGRVLLRAPDGPLGARAAGSVTAPRGTLAELVRAAVAVAVAPTTGRAACRLAGEHGVPDHTACAATTEAALADRLLGERRCAAPDLAGRAEHAAVAGVRDVRLDGSHRGQVARQLTTSGTRLAAGGGGDQQNDPDERDSHATSP